MKVPRDWRYKEVDDGDDIYASEDGLWHIPEFNGFHVVAGPMQHTMMCVGYVVQEKRGTDRLKMDAVEDVRSGFRVQGLGLKMEAVEGVRSGFRV